MPQLNRRQWGAWGAAAVCAPWGAPRAQAQPQTASAPAVRVFDPQPGAWRRFELTTRVEVLDAQGPTRVWLPVPALQCEYQVSTGHQWSDNARACRLVTDPASGAAMLVAEFDVGAGRPTAELTSTVLTRGRRVDWNQPHAVEDLDALRRRWTAPSALIATDGIVRRTAFEIVGDARGDVQRCRRIYDWVVARTHREPTVRGCGVGDITSMLQTGNFAGKCADINGLFVGLCRAVGIPARDLYGIRLAPSAFGYRELGAAPAQLQGAQHCRAEVYLMHHGWVAMDPADVTKVMRQETATWIRDAGDPLVAPVRQALFGGWEGNWLAYNWASDVALPGARYGRLDFLMYPQAENGNGRGDALDAEHFRYTISARESAPAA
jgi:transglutaminase-like putative cysteine protease